MQLIILMDHQMIISVESEKVFDKIQDLLMIKTLSNN